MSPDTDTLAGSADWRPDRSMSARRHQIANFVVFQSAWFAAILGAAHQVPLWGTACLLAAIAWHLGVVARPRTEAMLVLAAALLGAVIESGVVALGDVAYPSGQPVAWLAPYWMVALWGELAIALNVTLRWLKGRPLLAAAIGAVAGPLSFASGVRMGGARFIDQQPALLTLAVVWAAALPLLMWLSDRFDGVSDLPREGAGDAP